MTKAGKTEIAGRGGRLEKSFDFDFVNFQVVTGLVPLFSFSDILSRFC